MLVIFMAVAIIAMTMLFVYLELPQAAKRKFYGRADYELRTDVVGIWVGTLIEDGYRKHAWQVVSPSRNFDVRLSRTDGGFEHRFLPGEADVLDEIGWGIQIVYFYTLPVSYLSTEEVGDDQKVKSFDLAIITFVDKPIEVLVKYNQ